MRIKTWHLLLSLSLLVTLTVIGTAIAIPSSETTTESATACKGNHRSKKDFYKSIRMLPPSTVLEIVGNRVNYSSVEEGIELGSLELEPNYSVVPKEFSATSHAGCYGFTYCDTHKVVLLIDELPQKMCGILKN